MKQVPPKLIEGNSTSQKIREKAFRMRGNKTLLLNGTHIAFVRERRSCCKNVDSVVQSLDDKKGELYWKTTVALTRPIAGIVAQRTTRLTTNQRLQVRILPRSETAFLLTCFCCLVKQNKTTLSTDTRGTLLQPKEEMINQRGHSLYFGDES